MGADKADKNPDINQVRKYFDFYTKHILPHVRLCSTQNPSGCHSLDKHTSAVVFRGIDYALSLHENPMPVVFAGAFHDMARKNDCFDTEHGANAVPAAKIIMQGFQDILSESVQDSIIYAIKYHTIGRIAPDYISACLWDADRTRMSWIYGFDEKCFNTDRAKYVASQPAKNYINFQQRCIPAIFWSYEY